MEQPADRVYAERVTSTAKKAWLEEARRRAGRLERGEVEARDGEAALTSLEAKLRSIHSQ